MNEWLKNIRVGDKVVVDSRGLGFNRLQLRDIDRITETQIIIGPLRYRKTDGKRIGSRGFDACWLHPATPEVIASIESAERCLVLTTYNWRKATPELIDAVYALIKASKP